MKTTGLNILFIPLGILVGFLLLAAIVKKKKETPAFTNYTSYTLMLKTSATYTPNDINTVVDVLTKDSTIERIQLKSGLVAESRGTHLFLLYYIRQTKRRP